MKALIITTFSTLALLSVHAETINIVCTIPDFGAIASEIGGSFVKVTPLCRGSEDPHFVDPKPSYVKLLASADILLEGGLGLEEGWLPPLVQNARNRAILRGGRGYVDLSKGIHILEVPTTTITRADGDIHPLGNPHYWLDPTNAKTMAETICQKLIELDPEHAHIFTSNLTHFTKRLDEKLRLWSEKATPLKGTRIVTYHKSFEYFAARFGLTITGTLEPKPGIEPTPGHIRELIDTMRRTNTKIVLVENFRPRKLASRVASETGGKLVVVPVMVGGEPQIKNYFDLFEAILDRLLDAYHELNQSQ